MADMYYYNDVLLPALPADILPSKPYCWIMNHTINKKYYLFMTNSDWYFLNGAIHCSDNMQYWYEIGYEDIGTATEWALKEIGFYHYNFDDNRPIIWAGTDIRNGSPDSAVIYFLATKSYQAGDKLTTDTVAISTATMTAIADAIRATKHTTARFTPAQMATEIKGITAGGNSEKSMFTSSAAGRLVEVPRGIASSVNSLDFESTASGIITE